MAGMTGMPTVVIVFAYIILCTIIGLLGRNKTIGFWGFFFFAAILTPLVGLVVLIIARNREDSFI